MGLLGPKRVLCPAMQWTTIIKRSFVQLPGLYTVHFSSADGAAIEGECEERLSQWIFPGTPRHLRLLPVMAFERGLWNTFQSVRVRPTSTLTAVIE
jgi:hypothetical protein